MAVLIFQPVEIGISGVIFCCVKLCFSVSPVIEWHLGRGIASAVRPVGPESAPGSGERVDERLVLDHRLHQDQGVQLRDRSGREKER